MHVSITTAFLLMETLLNSGKYPEVTMAPGSEGSTKRDGRGMATEDAETR